MIGRPCCVAIFIPSFPAILQSLRTGRRHCPQAAGRRSPSPAPPSGLSILSGLGRCSESTGSEAEPSPPPAAIPAAWGRCPRRSTFPAPGVWPQFPTPADTGQLPAPDCFPSECFQLPVNPRQAHTLPAQNPQIFPGCRHGLPHPLPDLTFPLLFHAHSSLCQYRLDCPDFVKEFSDRSFFFRKYVL